ncbi:unnamed protein product, partial [Urochloa humidicola]
GGGAEILRDGRGAEILRDGGTEGLELEATLAAEAPWSCGRLLPRWLPPPPPPPRADVDLPQLHTTELVVDG